MFKDPLSVERFDDHRDYCEERFIIIGTALGGIVLVVVYTVRQGRIRILSARRATQYEQDDYFQ